MSGGDGGDNNLSDWGGDTVHFGGLETGYDGKGGSDGGAGISGGGN